MFDADVRTQIVATGLHWRVRDNGTGIEMLLVPPRTSKMGCSMSTLLRCHSSEDPVYTLTLTSPLYLGGCEDHGVRATRNPMRSLTVHGNSFPRFDARASSAP